MNYTFTQKQCLAVARSGSAGFVSFQINGCVVGDSAKILLLHDDIATTEHYLFLQTILSANRFKYAYGRKVTEENYMNDVIELPIQYNSDGTPFIDVDKKYSDNGYVPDWKFMEDYIKSLHYQPLATKNIHKAKELQINKWKEFRFGNLIQKPYKAKAFAKDELEETIEKNLGMKWYSKFVTQLLKWYSKFVTQLPNKI